jgi:carboxymethylenebutenolidase
LTAAAIWESLCPNYAWAQQVAKDDSRLKTEYIIVPSPLGNGEIRDYFVRPANATGKLPGILVVHENRGLNPYIEDVARRLGTENFMAFGPDGLTSIGGYPGDDEKGAKAFQQVSRLTAPNEDFRAAARWLKNRPDCIGKIGVVGFCFGRGIANTLAVRMGSDLAAAVAFYGAQPAAGCAEDQGRLATPLRLVGHPPDLRLACIQRRPESQSHHLLGIRLRRHATWFPQRHDGTLSRSSGKTRVAAHARVFQ